MPSERARALSPEPGSPYSRHLSAPLSPTHSTASVRSSGSAGSLGAGSSVGGPHVPSAPGSQPSQYRALTSTPAERKRTVAACRALRAQITQFEEAFARMHGRPPKGQSERAPLASTYMQYREWKRAIRSDAACRIQALCRGALARRADAWPRDPELGRFLRRRARERGGGGGGGAVQLQQQRTSLKAEKATLHQTLQSYEKDFHRRHGRQVSSFADIRPVAGQYRRYKEIKRAISAAQGDDEDGGWGRDVLDNGGPTKGAGRV